MTDPWVPVQGPNGATLYHPTGYPWLRFPHATYAALWVVQPGVRGWLARYVVQEDCSSDPCALAPGGGAG